ncbi:MAG: gliding motility-associated C-terminal domain-containing protein [Saprospiraceae bacterium]
MKQYSVKSLIIAGVWAGIMLATHTLCSQQLIRTVVGSSGASVATAQSHLRFTIAQPPGVGTLQSGTAFLRQGFQQPAGCASAPDAIFAIQPEGDPLCGGPYTFVYLDEPDDETSFQWSFGALAQPVQQSADFRPEGISFLTPGSQPVSLIVTTGDCIDTLTLQLAVQAAPLAIVENRLDLLCREEEDGLINLFVQGGTQPYQFNWSTGDTTHVIADLGPGLYFYQLEDANGCEQSDTVAITSPDRLDVAVQILPESCHGSSDGEIMLAVSGGTPPYSYEWSVSNADEVLSGVPAGTYAARVRDANNCSWEAQLTVDAACANLVFYELITPNGDGKNDNWVIEGIEYFPDNRLELYDRWGVLQLAREGYSSDWQGYRNDGSPLPAGTYYYVLWLNDPTNSKRTGAVSIIR